MYVLSTDKSLDELRDLAEQNGFSRNVVKSYTMVVYDIPDEAYHGVKRRGRAAKKHSESEQGVTDGD